MKILCNYDLSSECLHNGQVKCVECSRTDNLPWAIIEYHEKWCPDGQIISLWPSKEKAEEIYKLNDLDNHKPTNWEYLDDYKPSKFIIKKVK